MRLLDYDDLQVEVVRATVNPGVLVKLACDHTMLKKVDPTNDKAASRKLLKFLIKAEHTSVLEHASITVAIKNVSRSLLAQLSRQRMANITSQSQHYQDYSDAPMIVDISLTDDEVIKEGFEGLFGASLVTYKGLISLGVPREEARQVLPNAAAVNILWTVNARSLMLFLRQRMCARNVKEMRIFANEMHTVGLGWFPELFEFIGAPCEVTGGTCNQGSMKAEVCRGRS